MNTKTSPDPFSPLVCPVCDSILKSDGDSLACRECETAWPIRDGVPRFVEDEDYWGEISQDLMRTILRDSAQSGWEKALKDHLYESRRDIYDYVTDQTRTDWRYLIPLKQNSRVLDLGAGWGLISTMLAKSCGTVTAVEKIPERIEFTQLRLEQEKLRNVRLIQGDVLSLPFPPASFDCIICNGVLEWVGLFDQTRSPRESQLHFLRRLRRLLRPDGYLYVGIENRFGYKQILGGRDHSGLRFTSLVPRFAADMMMRFGGENKVFHLGGNRRPGYRTYTYTARGYARLLNRAGFAAPSVFYALPGYNQPLYLLPATSQGAFRYFFRNLFLPRTEAGRKLKSVAKLTIPGIPQRLVMADYCMLAQVGTGG